MIKKIFLTLTLLMFGVCAFATDADDAKAVFEKYVKDANAYSPNLINYYDSNAKIIRIVEKPDGTKAVAVFGMKDYESQLKIGSMTAKVRNYKNNYSDIKVVKVANGYKVNCKRQPTGETYKIPSHFIFLKTADGWKIVEESMNTKVQFFLKYVK